MCVIWRNKPIRQRNHTRNKTRRTPSESQGQDQIPRHVAGQRIEISLSHQSTSSETTRNQHLLRLSQNTLNEHSKRSIYCAHIQSHIQYGLVVWGPLCNKENLEKIRKLQETNAKLVNKLKGLQDLKLLTIDQLIVQELCKIGKRFLDNSLPGPIMRNMTTDATNESLIKTHHMELEISES